MWLQLPEGVSSYSGRDRRHVPPDPLDHRHRLRHRRGPAPFLPVPVPAPRGAAGDLHARKQPGRGRLDDRSGADLRHSRPPLPPHVGGHQAEHAERRSGDRDHGGAVLLDDPLPGNRWADRHPRRHRHAEPAPLSRRPPRGRDPALQRRDPFLLSSGVPREAGRGARHVDANLVRRVADGALGDRVRGALRPRPLPDEGLRDRGDRPRSSRSGSPRRTAGGAGSAPARHPRPQPAPNAMPPAARKPAPAPLPTANQEAKPSS